MLRGGDEELTFEHDHLWGREKMTSSSDAGYMLRIQRQEFPGDLAWKSRFGSHRQTAFKALRLAETIQRLKVKTRKSKTRGCVVRGRDSRVD